MKQKKKVRERGRSTKVSKLAICIAVVGGITALVSLIAGGGVVFLGRKPVAKSEGWYPSRKCTYSSFCLSKDSES